MTDNFPRIMALRRAIFWGLPRFIMPIVIQVRYKQRFKSGIHISFHNDMYILSEKTSAEPKFNTIAFYHSTRSIRYFNGIDERIETLLKEYCVNQISDLRSGNYVDIGSNIGEFSMGINSKFPGSTFIRFEPSEKECKASEINMVNTDDTLIRKALWREATILDFYERNQNGDSSIFSPDDESRKVSITTSTLDYEMDKPGIGEIQLLKLEAEGAEPEILAGGKSTLKRCKYVTADLGPERGISQERTFAACNQILESLGFLLIGRNPGSRECYLYANSALVTSQKTGLKSNDILSTEHSLKESK